MGLTPCPECKREISDKAYACPHCGLPDKFFPKLDVRKKGLLNKIIGEAKSIVEPPPKNYCGWTKTFYDNGKLKDLTNYKDGQVWSVIVFKPNGKKCRSTTMHCGNGSVLFYNNDGEVEMKCKYKNGKVAKMNMWHDMTIRGKTVRTWL